MGLALRRIAAMGVLADVQCIHPFTDAGFVSALASESGITGFGSRTEAMRALLGDALPPELIGRPTKASFDETLWNRHTRAFVEDLDGDVMATAVAALGLDALVDPRALAEHWAAPGPLGNSFLLLQACWLALEGSDHASGRRPPVPAVTG